MADEVPEESEEYETIQKFAVDGEVVTKLKMKPAPLTTDIEDEAASVALTVLLSALQEDETEEVVELLETYDPEVQLWAADEEEDEPSWKPAAPISETELLDEYKQL